PPVRARAPAPPRGTDRAGPSLPPPPGSRSCARVAVLPGARRLCGQGLGGRLRRAALEHPLEAEGVDRAREVEADQHTEYRIGDPAVRQAAVVEHLQRVQAQRAEQTEPDGE